MEKNLFIGRDKRKLQSVLPKIGHVNSALLCTVPKNIPDSQVAKAVACCRPRLEQDLEDSPGDIITMGKRAIQSILRLDSVDAWRGTKYGWRDREVMPTFGLQRLRGQPQYERIWEQDLVRARHPSSFSGWPKFVFQDDATEAEVLAELNRLALSSDMLGVDVETGGRSVKDSPLYCIGIADTVNGVSVKWPTKWPAVDFKVREILANGAIKKAMHNGQFDMGVFQYNGIEVNGYEMDTLVAHAIAEPELPHGLSFVASQYFDYPRWKTKYKKGDDNYANSEENREYNIKDCWLTALIAEKLQVAIKQRHFGEPLYDVAMQLARMTEEMRSPGLRISRLELNKWLQRLTEDIDILERGFEKLIARIPNCPPKTSLGKNGQNNSLKRLYFQHWNIPPMSYTDLEEPQLDLDFLAHHSRSENELVSLCSRIILLYRQRTKLRSTYVTNMDELIDSDGYVRPSWAPYRAITGRWACSQPNLQNQPKPMRNIWIPDDGMWVVSADYGQLELRLQAVLSGDQVLLHMFEAGLDLHLEIAKETFQKPDLPKSSHERKVTKAVIYGKAYGASAETIHANLLKEFPSMQLAVVKRVLKEFDKKFPTLAKFQKKLVKTAAKNDYIDCLLSGRRQYFFGKMEPTKTQNFPYQAGAGHIMNQSILRLNRKLDRSKGRLLSQVHDELNLQCYNVNYGADLLIDCMKRLQCYDNDSILLDVEVEYGRNWADIKVWEPGKTMEQLVKEYDEWHQAKLIKNEQHFQKQQQGLRQLCGV